MVKKLPATWKCSMPGLGRSPGKGKGYPLQYSGLENPMDYAVHGVAKSRRWLSDFHFASLPFTFVIAFLPRSKHLLISWLQSSSAVILEPPKIKSDTASTVSLSICHEVMEPDAMVLVFWMLSFKPAFHSAVSLSSKGSSVFLHFLL